MLLGNGAVNTFQHQRRIVGGVIFRAGRVVSKDRKVGYQFFPELLVSLSFHNLI
jgi:hypothetical protein